MKRAFISAVIIWLTMESNLFPQNNIYGEYLLSKSEKKVSLDLERASLVDVLKLLSQQTGINFISTEAIKERKLTLYLENVPLKQAMEMIFKANNLSYDYYPEANIFVIKEMGKPSIELKCKVYYLKYVQVSSSNIQTEIESNLGGKGGSRIKSAVEKVLSPHGKVVEDPATNSLIVVDVPAQFKLIEEVIKSLDRPTSKVMIEVEMLDVAKSLVDQLGVKFDSGLSLSYTPGTKTSAFPFPSRFKPPQKGMITMGLLDLSSSRATLQFLMQDSSTKYLARPKILTLSGKTAEIKITTDEATGIKKTESEGGSRVEYTIERTETGVRLRVTPQVNMQTREITLFLETVVKEAKDSEFVAAEAAFVTGRIKNPEERGTTSVLRLKDGETLLIGGLIRNDKTRSITKIPLLGDIPFLGSIFRYKSNNREERELLIFLTPRIVEEQHLVLKNKNERSLLREQSLPAPKKKIAIMLDEFKGR